MKKVFSIVLLLGCLLAGFTQHAYAVKAYPYSTKVTLPDGSVITTSCTKQILPIAASPAVGEWWETYSSCSKLKKNGIGDPTGPFRQSDPAQAVIYDWFANRTGNHGDGDGDGLACE